MFGILFFKIFYSKRVQFIQNGVSKQSSSCEVYGKDKIEYMETVEKMEE